MKTFALVFGFLAILWLLSVMGSLPHIVWYAIAGVILVGGVYCLLRFNSLNPRDKVSAKRMLRNNWWVFLVAAVPAILFSVLGWLPNLWSRGTPVAYYGFWWFLTFLVITAVTRCFVDREYQAELGCAIRDWARRGGCWKIYSEDNLPANSLAVLWLVCLLVVVLYGPPTPKIDFEDLVYQGKSALYQAENEYELGVSGFLTTLKEGVFGPSATDSASEAPNALPHKYHRGWGWILFCFLLTPVVASSLIWSRRDEVANWFDRTLSVFKRRRATFLSGEAVSTDELKGDGSAVATGKPSSTSFASLLASDAIAFALVETGEAVVKLLRR